jgi:hypothetical protein
VTVRESSFSLRADLAALGAKLGLFMADPPVLGGRVDAKGGYAGEAYEVTATASGLKVGTAGPIDAVLVQKGTLSFAPGGGLAIETGRLTSSAVDATLSGAVRKLADPDREGEIRLAVTLRPAELSKWTTGLGLAGEAIPVAATLTLTPGQALASGTAELKHLTMTSRGSDGKAVARTMKAQPLTFEVRVKGDDRAATLRSGLVEWAEPGYSARAGLEAVLAWTAAGTRGTATLLNLEVTDADRSLAKEPTVLLTHDIGLAPGLREIRTLKIASTFLNGSLSGTIRTAGAAWSFENLRGAFRYHPDRLGVILQPWLGGGRLAGRDEKSVTLEIDGRAPSSDPMAIVRAVRLQMDADLAPYTHTGLTVSGRTALRLDKGVLRTSSPLDVNKGRLGLTAAVDLREARDKPQSTLDVRAKDVDANADMAPLLSSINPIFHTVNGAVAGKSTADFCLAWAGEIDPVTTDWVKAAAPALRGTGTLAVKDLVITGSPVVGQIMQALGEGNILQGELVGTDIRIEGGRCHYTNMTLRLARYEIRFTGSVGFDKSLKLTVDLPMTAHMRKKYPGLERYLGPTLKVSLGGTAASPRLDFERTVQDAIKSAAPALLEDALKKILERRKKDK